MMPCKHLDYTEGKYTDCTIVEVPGFSCRVRYWQRGPSWTGGPGNEDNPVKVQFCGQGRGRINGVFNCYNPGEMSCYEPEAGKGRKEPTDPRDPGDMDPEELSRQQDAGREATERNTHVHPAVRGIVNSIAEGDPGHEAALERKAGV